MVNALFPKGGVKLQDETILASLFVMIKSNNDGMLSSRYLVGAVTI